MSDNGCTWAVVQTAADTFVGKIKEVGEHRVILEEAYIIKTYTTPVQTPKGTMMQVHDVIRSFGPCLESFCVTVVPSAVIYFDDMDGKDKQTMFELLETGKKMLQAERLQRAGMVTADAGLLQKLNSPS